MPLYETVMQEKPPVVLDIGTAYTKLGFAAEAHPRKIIPSVVILSTDGRTKSLFDYNAPVELYDQMVDFLQMIFFKHLLVSPKERKIVVVENVFGQTLVRDTLARVLFRHFEVSSVLFTPAHMIALSVLAVPSGVVVDVGYSETTVMPVFSGVQIMQAFHDQQYGGRAVHAEIRRQLLAAGVAAEGDVTDQLLTESVLEDIKVRLCFVTTLERAQIYREGKEPEQLAPSIEYPLCGGTNRDDNVSSDLDRIITIPGRLRETVFEVLFEENNEHDSLPHLILRAIQRAPVDVRRELIESVFVIGGTAIIMGLLPRLKAELQHLLTTVEDYKKLLPVGGDAARTTPPTFKFHKTIGRQNFSAWLGAALCGGTDLIQMRSLTKEVYTKGGGRVPDWICLSDNRLAGA